MDNLKRRGKIVVNACFMCLEDEETIDHLLLRCITAVKIWNTVICWFGCSWVFPKNVQDLFMAWKSPLGPHKGKEMWKLSFLVVIWHIWKERNTRCFEGVATNGDSIYGEIKFSVSTGLNKSHFQRLFGSPNHVRLEGCGCSVGMFWGLSCNHVNFIIACVFRRV